MSQRMQQSFMPRLTLASLCTTRQQQTTQQQLVQAQADNQRLGSQLSALKQQLEAASAAAAASAGGNAANAQAAAAAERALADASRRVERMTSQVRVRVFGCASCFTRLLHTPPDAPIPTASQLVSRSIPHSSSQLANKDGEIASLADKLEAALQAAASATSAAAVAGLEGAATDSEVRRAIAAAQAQVRGACGAAWCGAEAGCASSRTCSLARGAD
jgi:SWI/SNF-related matrix-associated actin-dependent regulator 1 of chromatin subfamily A